MKTHQILETAPSVAIKHGDIVKLDFNHRIVKTTSVDPFGVLLTSDVEINSTHIGVPVHLWRSLADKLEAEIAKRDGKKSFPAKQLAPDCQVVASLINLRDELFEKRDQTSEQIAMKINSCLYKHYPHDGGANNQWIVALQHADGTHYMLALVRQSKLPDILHTSDSHFYRNMHTGQPTEVFRESTTVLIPPGDLDP